MPLPWVGLMLFIVFTVLSSVIYSYYSMIPFKGGKARPTEASGSWTW